uniref:Secreted protein n=1 Tax=Myotis myotis TaxID=51298 RepID=A0A7J7U5F0_MYOMY|nr:hypothetical protein mMyoMyo1_008867 [Myotis myotis]
MQNPLLLLSLALDCNWQGPSSGVSAQLSPRVPHPLLLQTGRTTPFKTHIILCHLHQSVSQSHVAVAWDGSSVGFLFKSIHGLHNPVPVTTEHLLLLHVPVWECCCDTCYTVHGRKTNKTKRYLYIVEHSIHCSLIQQR